MVYQVKIISGDKLRTHFMQACDVFERSKVLGEAYNLEINTSSNADEVFANTIKALEGNTVLSFVHVDDERIWWNPKVRVVSDGKHLRLLRDWVMYLFPKLVVETDEHMFITKIYRNPNIH